MKRWIILSAVALMGCENAVLVNNRPPIGTENTSPDAQQANARIDANTTDSPTASANPTTRPADQTVETRNTRIESHSD